MISTAAIEDLYDKLEKDALYPKSIYVNAMLIAVVAWLKKQKGQSNEVKVLYQALLNQCMEIHAN